MAVGVLGLTPQQAGDLTLAELRHMLAMRERYSYQRTLRLIASALLPLLVPILGFFTGKDPELTVIRVARRLHGFQYLPGEPLAPEDTPN